MKRFSKEGKTLICFDFDETYFPHQCTEEQLRHVRSLEDFLEEHGADFSTMWVTGSSVNALQEKVRKANLRYFPHRIASSLGTELYYVNHRGEWVLDEAFAQRFPVDFLDRVNRVVKACAYDQIPLEPQPGFGDSRWIRSYYFLEDNLTSIEKISQYALDEGIAVNISKCNPQAGDPEGAYDIDFIPNGSGKAESIAYVSEQFDFSLAHAFAFGDSGNDIEMLRIVEHGYVLQNGTPQAKESHPRVTEQAYAAGILEVLKK